MDENINEHLAEQSQLSAQRAYEIAFQHRQDIIDIPHVFLALLDHPGETLLQVLNFLALDIELVKVETLKVIKTQSRVPFWKGKKYQMYITPLVKLSIVNAIVLAQELKKDKASSEHIFWGVVASSVNAYEQSQHSAQYKMCQIFGNNGLNPESILKALKEIEHHYKP